LIAKTTHRRNDHFVLFPYLPQIKQITRDLFSRGKTSRKFTRSFTLQIDVGQLIWFSIIQNTVTKIGPFLILGDAIHLAFKKAYEKEFRVRITTDWCHEIIRLRDQLGRGGASPPQIRLCEIMLGQKVSNRILTDKEIRAFLTSMRKRTKQEDHAELLALLKRKEPKMSFGEGKVQTDLRQLKPSTIRLACAIAKQKRSRESSN
jgi:hypothetical protein